uniref:Uncharacterized protein n=1 Tax=Vespula pensylvanica TaxID=30213 RepID=A0A834KU46_VESPE|nr:hypothetical protein H0235_012912 [Vespula pensylvanica]
MAVHSAAEYRSQATTRLSSAARPTHSTVTDICRLHCRNHYDETRADILDAKKHPVYPVDPTNPMDTRPTVAYSEQQEDRVEREKRGTSREGRRARKSITTPSPHPHYYVSRGCACATQGSLPKKGRLMAHNNMKNKYMDDDDNDDDGDGDGDGDNDDDNDNDNDNDDNDDDK